MNAKLEQLIKDEASAWRKVTEKQAELKPFEDAWNSLYNERRREEMRDELRKENNGELI